MTRELGLLLGPDQYLHLYLQEGSGEHQVDREVHNQVEREVIVAVDIGVEEEDGDHLFDLRLVGGRAAQGLLLVIDVVLRGIWYETVQCRLQMYVISADSRVT